MRLIDWFRACCGSAYVGIKIKGKGKGRYRSSWEPHLRATGRHLPYGITQCYLPPDTSESAPPNPNRNSKMSLLFVRLSLLCMDSVVDTNCNPSFFGGHNSTEGASDMSKVVLGVDWKSIVSLVIFLACVLYARFVMQFLSCKCSTQQHCIVFYFLLSCAYQIIIILIILLVLCQIW